MGLFVDMSPEEMLMGMDDNLDDPSLEAELAAITGDKPPAGGRAKPKGKGNTTMCSFCSKTVLSVTHVVYSEMMLLFSAAD